MNSLRKFSGLNFLLDYCDRMWIITFKGHTGETLFTAKMHQELVERVLEEKLCEKKKSLKTGTTAFKAVCCECETNMEQAVCWHGCPIPTTPHVNSDGRNQTRPFFSVRTPQWWTAGHIEITCSVKTQLDRNSGLGEWEWQWP